MKDHVKKEDRPEGKPQASLDELFKAGENIEDAELALALKGKVSLAQGADRVFMEGAFAKEGVRRKILAAGLSRHVLARKGLIKEDELARPTEWYAAQVQEKPKSVVEELSRLKAKDFFERTDRGYLIPLWALQRAIDALKSKKPVSTH